MVQAHVWPLNIDPEVGLMFPGDRLVHGIVTTELLQHVRQFPDIVRAHGEDLRGAVAQCRPEVDRHGGVSVEFKREVERITEILNPKGE